MSKKNNNSTYSDTVQKLSKGVSILHKIYAGMVSYIFNVILESKYARLMRMHKISGFLLVILPVLWIITLAATTLSDWLYYCILFSAGAFMMRGAGCIINDIVDVEIDKQVERTKNRPIASGEIAPGEALVILAALLFGSLAILLILPSTVLYMGILTLIPVVIYPIMKRHSFYPQLFLGLVFNIGILMAWYSVKGYACLAPLLVYCACVAWTMAYDTIYAFQDIKDDTKIDVGSMARALGEKAYSVIGGLYVIFVLLLIAAGLWLHVGYAYHVGVVVATLYLYLQLIDLDIKDPIMCDKKFNSNVLAGFIILVGAILSKWL